MQLLMSNRQSPPRKFYKITAVSCLKVNAFTSRQQWRRQRWRVMEMTVDEDHQLVNEMSVGVYHDTPEEASFAAHRLMQKHYADLNVKYAHVCEERDMLMQELEQLKQQKADQADRQRPYVVIQQDGTKRLFATRKEAMVAGKTIADGGRNALVAQLVGQYVVSTSVTVNFHTHATDV